MDASFVPWFAVDVALAAIIVNGQRTAHAERTGFRSEVASLRSGIAPEHRRAATGVVRTDC